MKIVRPHKISSEILDIIHMAEQYIVIVSPYVNFKYWVRFADELKNAKNRNIRIDFFVRNEAENVNSWEQVEELGIEPRLINNLHAKFYFNEKSGIISSMNLLSSSHGNSIEIGTKLDTSEELDELKNFVKNIISPNEVKERPSSDDLYLTKEKISVVLENYIANGTRNRTKVYFKNNALNIRNGSNTFYLSIDKVNNMISIEGILTVDQADKLSNNISKHFKSNYFDYKLNRGGKGYYDVLKANSKVRLSKSFLDHLRVNEKKQLIAEVSDFVEDVNKFKYACN